MENKDEADNIKEQIKSNLVRILKVGFKSGTFF